MRIKNDNDLFYTLLAMTNYVSLGPAQERALKLYNKGLPRKRSASIMNISEHTFAWYIRQVRKKFCISTRGELRVLQQVLMSKKMNFVCENEFTLHLKGDGQGWHYNNSDQVS